MFDNIAPTYDKLNHILSFDIDKLWRKRVVRIVRKLGAKHIMDMATGTGDLAIAMAKKIDGTTIYGADFSSEMLAVAKQKIEHLGLSERISLTERRTSHSIGVLQPKVRLCAMVLSSLLAPYSTDDRPFGIETHLCIHLSSRIY